ncbi:MAG: ABC transporter permease [Bifidobacteriaceae bacterium]|jgi:ABC-2 type transport system permease protein|nr:ABC transporter permease [Bifidobacteriaceae bacterium]
MTAAPNRTHVPPAARGPRLTFGGVVRSEWIKLRSLRSTWWTIGAMMAAMTGLVALLGANVESSIVETTAEMEAQNPAEVAATLLPDLTATMLGAMGVIFMVVLSVLAVAGEYASGSIRATLTAVPRRLPVLAAKTVVVGSVTLAAAAATTAVASGVGWAVMSARGIELGLSPTSWRMLAGGVLYTVAMSLLALGVGAIARSAAGGISITLGVLFALPLLAQLLPESLRGVADWLPDQAGRQVFTVIPDPATGGAWGGFGVLLAWTALSLGVAAYLLRRRDA